MIRTENLTRRFGDLTAVHGLTLNIEEGGFCFLGTNDAGKTMTIRMLACLISKPNGGKASALDYGLLFARGEIVITIDSDSMVAGDAIDEVVRLMENPNVVAIAGNIRVLNSKSLLTRVQELEYIMAINIIRRALRFSARLW
ncbi:MAG: glycosyltransferase [Thaumarchaeota archaeon]|nr:glycosyltransferase [Nitrososphaerota archaeon]